MSSATATTYLPAVFIEAATSSVDVDTLSLPSIKQAMKRISAVSTFFHSLYGDMGGAPQEDRQFVDQSLDRWEALETLRDAIETLGGVGFVGAVVCS